jgi:hypothetical protein
MFAALMHPSAGRQGAVFLLTVLLLAGVLLLAVNIYMGFRAGVAAGNCAATAGICAAAGFSTGGLFVFFRLIA